MFQKSPKRSPSMKRPKSTVEQMALSSNQYALKVQGLEKIQAETAAPKVPEWPTYGNFWKVTRKNPHFLKKSKGGTGGKKSPKKQPLFERPKSTLAAMALSPVQYALKVQRLDKILAHKAAPKVPEWPGYGNFHQAQTAVPKVPELPSYGNFCKVTQNPHFL